MRPPVTAGFVAGVGVGGTGVSVGTSVGTSVGVEVAAVVAVGVRVGVDVGGTFTDLVVVDGGKGQLSSAVEALREVEAYGRFPVVGLAKRLEEVFFDYYRESAS